MKDRMDKMAERGENGRMYKVGKGGWYRPCDKKKFDEGMDRIFGTKKDDQKEDK